MGMKEIITVHDLHFGYVDTSIFEYFSLHVEEGTYLSIVGLNGSGKSTLVKLLVGLLWGRGTITIDSVLVSRDSIQEVRKKIGIVFENPENQFVCEIVRDDILFCLQNIGCSKEEAIQRVEKIAQLLEMESLLDCSTHMLSGGERQLVALACALVTEPKILILDEAFTMIDAVDKERLLQIIKKLHQEQALTILSVSHDMEDILYADEILVLDEGKIVLKGDRDLVLQEEETFRKLGLELPFMVQLSNKLKYYGLVDEMVLDMNEMVDKLWK